MFGVAVFIIESLGHDRRTTVVERAISTCLGIRREPILNWAKRWKRIALGMFSISPICGENGIY